MPTNKLEGMIEFRKSPFVNNNNNNDNNTWFRQESSMNIDTGGWKVGEE